VRSGRLNVARWLEAIWYAPSPPPRWLRGLAALYGWTARCLASRRRQRQVRLPVPVIVVGNIGVGGTGKTPFVIWLVERLRQQGLRPGIVSRGYGGRPPRQPLRVTAETDPAHCGDEPALMARRLGVPVAVAADRVAAARMLIDSGEVDLLVADDGLQHYRLARDLEICIVDGVRGLGNGALLPAGPLREPPSRLADVGLVVVNGGRWRPDAGIATPVVDMQLEAQDAVALDGGASRPLASFRGQRVHAVAGIGHPARFFATLCRYGMEVSMHPFPDHHRYRRGDLEFGAGAVVLMTEKDAVKCRAIAHPDGWYVPVQARLADEAAAGVQQLLAPIIDRLNTPSDG
jgi:tetraacyldisaccharide 4'-kinase